MFLWRHQDGIILSILLNLSGTDCCLFQKRDYCASIDKVLYEIKEGNDELKNWAETEYVNYFQSTKVENGF